MQTCQLVDKMWNHIAMIVLKTFRVLKNDKKMYIK